MTHDHRTLRLAGEALHGPFWHSALACDLQVSLRTVQRWANGTYDVPGAVWVEIAGLCRARGAELAKIADDLEYSDLIAGA